MGVLEGSSEGALPDALNAMLVELSSQVDSLLRGNLQCKKRSTLYENSVAAVRIRASDLCQHRQRLIDIGGTISNCEHCR